MNSTPSATTITSQLIDKHSVWLPLIIFGIYILRGYIPTRIDDMASSRMLVLQVL